MSTVDQLDEAMHELDDIFLELQSLDKAHALNRDNSKRNFAANGTSFRNDNTVTLSSPKMSKTEAINADSRLRDVYASPSEKRSFQLRPSSGYYSEDEIYKLPKSTLVEGAMYQTPRPRDSNRFATSSYHSSQRIFSEPTLEPTHGSFGMRFSTVGNTSAQYSSVKTPPRKRIMNEYDFPRPLDTQNEFLSKLPGSDVQFQPSTLMSHHSESDYDEVPNESNDEVFPRYYDGVPEYDEIPNRPSGEVSRHGNSNVDVISSDVIRTKYDVNATLPRHAEVVLDNRSNPNIKYTQVKIKKSRRGEGGMEIARLKTQSSELAEDGVPRREDNKHETVLRNSNGMSEVRRMTTQLGINFDDDEWDDVSRRASRMTIGPPDIPTPVGPVIDATKTSPIQRTQFCKCRCHLVMSILSVLAIAIFLFTLGSFIYIGVKNDNEISARRMDAERAAIARDEMATALTIVPTG